RRIGRQRRPRVGDRIEKEARSGDREHDGHPERVAAELVGGGGEKRRQQEEDVHREVRDDPVRVEGDDAIDPRERELRRGFEDRQPLREEVAEVKQGREDNEEEELARYFGEGAGDEGQWGGLLG